MNASIRHTLRRAALVIGIAALVITAFALGTLWHGDANGHEGHGHGPLVQAGDGQYTCPMHPHVRMPNADDRCPICGMALVPVPDNGDTEPDERDLPVLRLSPRSAALLNVRVAPAERRAVETDLRFVGRIDYDETRLIDVVPRADGYIERLHADYLYQPVREGEPVAEFHSPSVIAAAKDLVTAARRLRGEDAPARQTRALESARANLRIKGVSPEQIDRVYETGEVPHAFTIYAPTDGVVAELPVRRGDHLAEGGRIIRIADLSHVWVKLDAYETDLAFLRHGQAMRFTTQAYPGEEFEGTVAYIDPVVDDRTRTARVRIDVPNPDGRLKPGMFLRGSVRAMVAGELPERVPELGIAHAARGGDIQLASADGAAPEPPAAEPTPPLLIPASAPLITGRRAIVYIQDPDAERPTFEGRQITLGQRVGDSYIVRDGLEEGELVVTQGAFKIDSELQIRGRPSMMSPPEQWAQRTEPLDVPEEFQQALTPVYEHYLAASQALAHDDLPTFQDEIKRMHEAVRAIDPGDLDERAAKGWAELAEKLLTYHENIDELEELDQARIPFETHSEAAIELAQRFGHATDHDLAVAHCPMAFDDAGADWLQVGEQVENPYFGAAMFRCGDITEHLD